MHRKWSHVKLTDQEAVTVLQVPGLKCSPRRLRVWHGGVEPLAPPRRPQPRQGLSAASVRVSEHVAHQPEVAAVVGVEATDPERIHFGQRAVTQQLGERARTGGEPEVGLAGTHEVAETSSASRGPAARRAEHPDLHPDQPSPGPYWTAYEGGNQDEKARTEPAQGVGAGVGVVRRRPEAGH